MKKTDLINELFKAKVISIIGAKKIEEIIQDIRKSLENYVEVNEDVEDVEDDYLDLF